jgi:hypothetical protein
MSYDEQGRLTVPCRVHIAAVVMLIIIGVLMLGHGVYAVVTTSGYGLGWFLGGGWIFLGGVLGAWRTRKVMLEAAQEPDEQEEKATTS